MDYNKKKHVDKNDMQISFWSTDDNILCKDRKTLRENIEEIDKEFEKKADKNEVFTMANMGQDIKEAMTGGSVAVVGVNTILEENIVRGEVTPLRTSFFVEGKNLFNKNSAIIGYYVNYQNGELVENNSYITSDYILVYPNTTYTMTQDEVLRIAFYDAKKTFISGLNTGAQVVITPVNCCYIRYSFKKETIDIQQFEIGSSSTKYVDYVKPSLNLTYILPNTLNGAKIEDDSITSKKLTIINHKLNLFDGNYTNYKIGGETGSLKLQTGNGNCRTAIIKVEPNTTYSIIRQTPSRFNYGTATHELKVEEILDGSINVNNSGTGESSNNSYVTFTTGSIDRYLYINTAIDGKEILLQVVKGVQSEFTIRDYKHRLNNVDVYNREEIDSKMGKKCRFLKKGDCCTIMTTKSKFIFKRVINDSINVDAWRLYQGMLRYEDDSTFTMWEDSDAEGAIQIVGEDDFVCGYHGDEIYENIDIIIDGKPIDISQDYDVLFDTMIVTSVSKVYHCNTSENANKQAFKRYKMLKFEDDKLVISNRFICLEDLKINRASLGLFQCKKDIINNFSNNNDLIIYDVPNTDTGLMPEASKNMTEATFYTDNGEITVKINKGYEHEKYMGYIVNFNDQNRLKIYFDYIKGSTLVNTGDILQTEFEISIK